MSDEMDSDEGDRCTDCGRRPVWRWATPPEDHYCRECFSKAGNTVYAWIDPDKLEELIGTYMADRVIRECT